MAKKALATYDLTGASKEQYEKTKTALETNGWWIKQKPDNKTTAIEETYATTTVVGYWPKNDAGTAKAINDKTREIIIASGGKPSKVLTIVGDDHYFWVA